MLVEKTQISLNKIRLYAYHGVLPQENKVGGWYTLTLRVDYPFSEAVSSDDVADTLDYSQLLEIAKREMNIPSRLLEHVAGRIASAVFETFPKTERIELELCKENPPMGSDTSGATVLLCAKNDKTDL